MDFGRYLFWLDGKEVKITPKEFELLAFFVRNEGRVITRPALFETIWGANLGGSSRSMDIAVERLRKKLGSFGRAIVSLRGIGFRFEPENDGAA
jgi:DNA-binding response OmpR family regulator